MKRVNFGIKVYMRGKCLKRISPNIKLNSFMKLMFPVSTLLSTFKYLDKSKDFN